MLADSFSLRRAAVGYVFQAQPELRREDNLAFYDRVTAQGLDVPQFNQQRTLLQLARVIPGSPQGKFEIEVGHHQGAFRFLVVETWPTRPLKLLAESADIAWECFGEIWQPNRVGRPVIVETNIRMSAAADGGDATKFLADRCLRISHQALAGLGRSLQGIGVSLMFPVEVSGEPKKEIPLDGANATIRVETLLDDQSRLYFDLLAKWPSVPVPPEVRQAPGIPEVINPTIHGPSEYLERSYDFLTRRVAEFLLKASKG